MCATPTKTGQPCRATATWRSPSHPDRLQCRIHAERTARAFGRDVITSSRGGRRRLLAPQPSPRSRRRIAGGKLRGEAAVIAAAAQARDSHELHAVRLAAITQGLFTHEVYAALRAARARLTAAAEAAIANARELAYERGNR